MKTANPCWTLTALALTGAIAACSRAPEASQEARLEPSAEQSQAQNEETPAEPSSDGTLQITDLIRLWVASAAGEDDVYDIPEKGDKKVAGVLAEFHKVHQTKDDSYSVCVDFVDGENIYDVDFFVDRADDGLVVADHHLHKVNGETVE
jgi:hypothetical protein